MYIPEARPEQGEALVTRTAPGAYKPDEPGPLLVGREPERGVLRRRLTAALAGRGALVLISGAAGVGKTALAGSLCQEAETAGARVLRGQCYDVSATPPYGPWAELLHNAGPVDDVPSPVPPEPGVTLPGLLEFLGVQSRRQPVLLVLEDLQWADPDSLNLLRVVSRWAARRPALLLATVRDDELPGNHPFNHVLQMMEHESRVERVALGPLSPDALGELITVRYPLPEPDTARLTRHLDHLADGNALFTVHLLRALEDDGVLRRNQGDWELRDLAETHVPRVPGLMIEERHLRLDEHGQSVLLTAAVLGQDVSIASLSLVAGVSEQDLIPIVESATAARLVEQASDGASFRFVHALIREALYQQISPVRRRAEHRRIAETLAALPQPDPDVVAHHFQKAGDPRAASWLVSAGERAEFSGASLTAEARYTTVLHSYGTEVRPDQRAWVALRLALLRRYDTPRDALTWVEDAQRVATATGDDRLAARVPLVRGMLRVCADGIRAGVDDVAAGVALVDRLRPAARASGPEQPIDDVVNRGMLAALLAWSGRLDEATRQYRRSFDDGGAATRAGAAWAAGFAHALTGDAERSRQYFAEASRAFESLGHHRSVMFVARDQLTYLVLPYLADQSAARAEIDAVARLAAENGAAAGALDEPAVYASYPLLPLMVLNGRWDEARETIATLLGRSANPISRRVLCSFLGPLARAQGDPDLAWRLVREIWPGGAATAPGESDVYHSLSMQRLAAALALDAGDLDTAASWVSAHDRWLVWAGVHLGRSESDLLWARYYYYAGDTGRARDHAERALAAATRPRQPLALLTAHRSLGRIDIDAGRHLSADRHLSAATALAESCDAPHEQAMNLAARAELWLAGSHDEQASMALAEAQTICRRLGAARTLARVDGLIATLGRGAPGAGRPAGLTSREAEILGLLASGRSNKEIAAHLVLSVRTVERHLTGVYRKIGAQRRTEAMAFALRHGLARVDPPKRSRTVTDLT